MKFDIIGLIRRLRLGDGDDCRDAAIILRDLWEENNRLKLVIEAKDRGLKANICSCVENCEAREGVVYHHWEANLALKRKA